MISQRTHSLPRRGSVIIIVLWAIAVAAIVTSSIQLFGQRQATLGRESLERVQARWAARAGIEATLAVMTQHTEKPIADDALAMVRDMYYVRTGQTINASYSIYHHVDGRNFGGPMDEHSKLNINRTEDRNLLLVLDDMTLDILDAIGDWMDPDDDISALGVERDYYLALQSPYQPRNGPIRSLGEIELIAGVWPKYFRGEDWNLDNRLDPNEDDGGHTMPPDNADGILDTGWSGKLTAYSTMSGATESGKPRIWLKHATEQDLQDRLGITSAQASSLIAFGNQNGAVLSDLLSTPLAGTAPNTQSSEPGDGKTNTDNGSGGTSTGSGGMSNGSGGPGREGTGRSSGSNKSEKQMVVEQVSQKMVVEQVAQGEKPTGGSGGTRGGGGGPTRGGDGNPRGGGGGGNRGGGGGGGAPGMNGAPGAPGANGAPQPTAPLTTDQLRAVFAETCVEDPLDRLPGKLNLNTVPAQFLRDILEYFGMDDAIADEIIYMRDSRPQGITSIVDLQKIPNITPDELKVITRRFDTTSNVYTISSRGRSDSSQLEVEIIAVVDRSTVPVRIIEYREQ